MRFCSETVSEKTYRTNLRIYRFTFSDAIFHRSKLCRDPKSEKVKLALSLEPYGIVWWNFPCPLILTRSRPRGRKISLSIHWSRLCRCPNCKNLKIAHNSWTIRNIWIKTLYTHWYWQDPAEGISKWLRSKLCRSPNSENVKLAPSLEPYGDFLIKSHTQWHWQNLAQRIAKYMYHFILVEALV